MLFFSKFLTWRILLMKAIQTIAAFLDVVKTQNALFSPAALLDLSQLEQGIATLADNQYDDMAKAIRGFCKKYPPIREAVMSRTELGKDRAGSDTSYPKLTPDEEKIARQLLANEIRRLRDNAPTSS
jgi:hypothetical protein